MQITKVEPLQQQLRSMRTALVREMATPNPEGVTRDQIVELAAIQTAIRAVHEEMDEPLRTAFQQVGQFLFHFARLERAVDDGIGKLFGIKPGALDIMASNVDFGRKLNLFFSAENFAAEMPDGARKALLKTTFSGVMAVNDDRKIVAHCDFSAGKDGGLVFRRAVAKQKLKVDDVEWTGTECQQTFEKIDGLTSDIRRIVDEMVPYEPKLDFSDPRNSMYVAALL